jgi:hypothetical protein
MDRRTMALLIGLTLPLVMSSACKSEDHNVLATVGEQAVTRTDVAAYFDLSPNFQPDEAERYFETYLKKRAILQETVRAGYIDAQRIQKTAASRNTDELTYAYMKRFAREGVSDAAIEEHQSGNPTEFSREQLRVARVQVWQGSDPSRKEANKHKLEDALWKARNGGDLRAIARELSLEYTDLGWMDTEKVATLVGPGLNLESGEVSSIDEGRGGYYYFYKVLEGPKTNLNRDAFRKARSELRERAKASELARLDAVPIEVKPWAREVIAEIAGAPR